MFRSANQHFHKFQSLQAKCEKALPPLVDFATLGTTKRL